MLKSVLLKHSQLLDKMRPIYLTFAQDLAIQLSDTLLGHIFILNFLA